MDNNGTNIAPILDKNILQNVQALMKAKFPIMVEKYTENIGRYINQAEEGIIKKDARLVGNAVHPLKSSSASMGAMKASAIAKDIEFRAEDILENGGNIESLSPLMNELKTVLAETTELLSKEACVITH